MIKYYKICRDCKSFKKFATHPRLSNQCGVCGKTSDLEGYELEDIDTP